MCEIPQSPEKVPENVSLLIKKLGKEWNSIRPRIDPNVLKGWDKTIKEWSVTASLPLIVRKSNDMRGVELKHETGRSVIISDNSPAQWSCYLAYCGNVPKIEDIRENLKNDGIPMSFAVKKGEEDFIKYKKTLGNYSLNKSGWKLCHRKPVGLNSSEDISQIHIKTLIDSFTKLMSPSNFFLVPLKWGGLGELQEFIDEMND